MALFVFPLLRTRIAKNLTGVAEGCKGKAREDEAGRKEHDIVDLFRR